MRRSRLEAPGSPSAAPLRRLFAVRVAVRGHRAPRRFAAHAAEPRLRDPMRREV